eukprot:3098254-Prymnesium_polylepis.1
MGTTCVRQLHSCAAALNARKYPAPAPIPSVAAASPQTVAAERAACRAAASDSPRATFGRRTNRQPRDESNAASHVSMSATTSARPLRDAPPVGAP